MESTQPTVQKVAEEKEFDSSRMTDEEAKRMDKLRAKVIYQNLNIKKKSEQSRQSRNSRRSRNSCEGTKDAQQSRYHGSSKINNNFLKDNYLTFG